MRRLCADLIRSKLNASESCARRLAPRRDKFRSPEVSNNFNQWFDYLTIHPQAEIQHTQIQIIKKQKCDHIRAHQRIRIFGLESLPMMSGMNLSRCTGSIRGSSSCRPYCSSATTLGTQEFSTSHVDLILCGKSISKERSITHEFVLDCMTLRLLSNLGH